MVGPGTSRHEVEAMRRQDTSADDPLGKVYRIIKVASPSSSAELRAVLAMNRYEQDVPLHYKHMFIEI